MSNTDQRSPYFKKLKNAIIRNKGKAVIDQSKEGATLSLMGLIYSIDSTKEESITFDAIDINFVLKPNGEILMMELQGDSEVSFYEIEEGDFKKKIYEYLEWRTDVVNSIGI